MPTTPPKTYYYIEQLAAVRGLWETQTMVVGRVEIKDAKLRSQALKTWQNRSPDGVTCRAKESEKDLGERKMMMK